MDLTALNQAIATGQTAEATLTAADSADAAAQAQLDAATAAKDATGKTDADAKSGFNAAMDALSQAALASKV